MMKEAISAVLLAGAALASTLRPAVAADALVRTVPQAKTATAGGFYAPNRAPLRPTAFMRLPVGSIRPEGWLRQQLELDAAGLVGGLPEISDYLKFAGNGWVDPHSNTGWEELPYWLRGYGDLGYVLRDPKIIRNARRWIDGILADQRPDGYFGPERLRTAEHGLPDVWPHMLVLDAVHSYYEFSHDPRALKFMIRYFHWLNSVPPETFDQSWAGVRESDNLSMLYWLYNRTGDAWLLELAGKIHAHSANYATKIPTWHNVNLAQGIREPAEYGQQAGDPRLLADTERDYEQVTSLYGQFPGGGFAGDENCRPGYGDPRQGLETCGIVELMRTAEIMTRLSGDPIWSDRCEDLAFNSLPAALTPDHKGLHYITCANCIRLDNQAKGNDFQNRWAMLAYKPGAHDYRCCAHNHGIGWPYFAESLWLATADRGLCASLYAPSVVRAKVGDGAPVTISEETGYPFRDTIRLRLSLSRTERFPLYLRIPRWCARPALQVNGTPVAVEAGPRSYLIVARRWKAGDSVTLRLPMRLAVRTWRQNKDAVSVYDGPLAFSLAIPARWTRSGGSDAWPEYAVLPAGAWNYGLALDARAPARSIRLLRKAGPLPAQPFTPETAPLSLRVPARKIPGWQADPQGVVGVLPPSPVRSNQPLETITLIPMGAARVRLTAFPTIATDPHLRSEPR